MWHDLYSFAKVVAPTFLVKDMLVDLAGSDVVVSSESNSEIAFVIPKI